MAAAQASFAAPGAMLMAAAGPQIVSHTIDLPHVQAVAAIVRRKPIIWDNLFANDYDQRRLYLGPFSRTCASACS